MLGEDILQRALPPPLPSRSTGLGVARARCLGDPGSPAYGAWGCPAATDLEFKRRRGPLNHRVTLKQSCIFLAAPGPRPQCSQGGGGDYMLPFQAPASGQIDVRPFFVKLRAS